MPFCHYSGNNLWILKATKLNQGQGIHVCNSLPQIKNLIQRYCEGFPKKYSENFTYEREIQNNKKQSSVGSNNNNNLNVKTNNNSPSKNDQIKNDEMQQNSTDQNLDEIAEEGIESPLLKDDTLSRKKHSSNSKLSFSVPAQKTIKSI